MMWLRYRLDGLLERETDMDALVTSILRLNEQGLSVAGIARRLKISKILITAGAWSSPLSLKIAKMREDGKSIDEIAESLGMTRNAVLSYTPYDRGMQGAEYPSVNALRIRACRAKKKGAENG